MALDRVLHGNLPARSELEVMKDRKEELMRLMAAEWKAAGHSNAWDDMAGEVDRLSDDIFEREHAALEAEEEEWPRRPLNGQPWG